MLTNANFREFFERINRREKCRNCRKEREGLGCTYIDKKASSYAENLRHYSNLLVGFSSINIEETDLLVIAQEHGGGRLRDFGPSHDRFEQNLDEEVDSLERYYLKDDVKMFHQSEMRKLFKYFEKAQVSWVFADLFRCYLANGNIQKSYEIARKYCGEYLIEEIKFLRPKIVLILGGKVHKYFNVSIDHGKCVNSNQLASILPSTSICISSYFPFARTADIWAEHLGWDPIIEVVREFLTK